jgi:hypothetical protein
MPTGALGQRQRQVCGRSVERLFRWGGGCKAGRLGQDHKRRCGQHRPREPRPPPYEKHGLKGGFLSPRVCGGNKQHQERRALQVLSAWQAPAAVARAPSISWRCATVAACLEHFGR